MPSRSRAEGPKRAAIAVAGSAAIIALGLGSLDAQGPTRKAATEPLSIDRYVRVTSTVPSMAGQSAALYVRERVKANAASGAPATSDRVVLFVHGAGTPAEVAFDVPYADYSWMAYLADAGFDVFSMDQTGYGRSTRPFAMNDPCNLAANQQPAFVPSLIAAPCLATYPGAVTTIASDWNDIGAVVDHIRALRHTARVSVIGWSLGGPRAAGYTLQHPEAVEKLVLLAPAYGRTSSGAPPASLPVPGVPMNTQSHDEFIANWDRQVGCPGQYDPAAADAVWRAMLESDPVGATWGTGVRRAPQTTVWGWNQEGAAKITVPTLLVSGAHDAQVAPDRVRELYADLGSRQKVFVDLACSSHNAAWERNHVLLYRASLEWLTSTTVNGSANAMLRIGY